MTRRRKCAWCGFEFTAGPDDRYCSLICQRQGAAAEIATALQQTATYPGRPA